MGVGDFKKVERSGFEPLIPCRAIHYQRIADFS
jgi:hypothetical protein